MTRHTPSEIAPYWPGHSCFAWFSLVDTLVLPGVTGVTAGTWIDDLLLCRTGGLGRIRRAGHNR